MTTLQTVTRPNGKLYRPRKPPEVRTCHNHHLEEGVAVWRTHDPEAAWKLAERQLIDMEFTFTDHQLVWWRSVPWDPYGIGDWSFLNDNVRGVPAVVWLP